MRADVWTFQKEELCLHITPGMEHPTLSVMVPMAIQDPGLFKCLITAAQSLYERRRNPDPRRSVRSKALILAQNDAIQALQKRLSQPDAPFDDGVVMSVLHLMTADVSHISKPTRHDDHSDNSWAVLSGGSARLENAP